MKRQFRHIIYKTALAVLLATLIGLASYGCSESPEQKQARLLKQAYLAMSDALKDYPIVYTPYLPPDESEALAEIGPELIDSMLTAGHLTVEDMLKLTGLSLARKDFKQAGQFCDIAMDKSVALDDPRLMAAANSNQGVIHMTGPFTVNALEPFTDALALHRQLGDRPAQAVAMRAMAMGLRPQIGLDTALVYLTEALAIDREFGNRKAVAVDLRSLAFYYNSLKQLEPAIQYHRESWEVFHELGDARGEATQLQSVGATHRFGGQLDSAEFYVRKALSVAVENGINRNIKMAEDELKRIAEAREQ